MKRIFIVVLVFLLPPLFSLGADNIHEINDQIDALTIKITQLEKERAVLMKEAARLQFEKTKNKNYVFQQPSSIPEDDAEMKAIGIDSKVKDIVLETKIDDLSENQINRVNDFWKNLQKNTNISQKMKQQNLSLDRERILISYCIRTSNLQDSSGKIVDNGCGGHINGLLMKNTDGTLIKITPKYAPKKYPNSPSIINGYTTSIYTDHE